MGIDNQPNIIISHIDNNGVIQDVKHYHMHIKPFYNNEPSLTIDDTYKKLTD